jgi:signal transduction histidine kinase
MVLDISFGTISAVESALRGTAFAREAGIPVVLGILLGMAVGATLVLRRQYPIAVVLMAIVVIPAQMGYLLAAAGLYTLAASEVPRRIIGLLAGMEALSFLVVLFIRMRQDDTPGSAGFLLFVAALVALIATLPPMLLGMYVGARRRLVYALRERADGLERELSLLADRAEERAEWARNEERTRIAREMHDVVAHRVSLMVVHAAAAQAVALKDPEKAAKNAALVGDMGRQALTELRTMLGVLRAEKPLAKVAESAAAAAGQEAGERGPGRPDRSGDAGKPGDTGGSGGDEPEGPRLGELDRLIEESRAAGMLVELSVEGEAQAYPTAVERTAYRVVQEALTNVHKHSGGARTQVRVAHRDSEVAVLIENAAPRDGVADAGLPSGGNGLVGMKERVNALGGGLVSGPTTAGGFRVSAIIPDHR